MYKIQMFLGAGKGWRTGSTRYSLRRLLPKMESLEKLGIIFRILKES